jgi:hypothetical protein
MGNIARPAEFCIPLEQKVRKQIKRSMGNELQRLRPKETLQPYIGIIVGTTRDGDGSGSNSDSDAQFLGSQ